MIDQKLIQTLTVLLFAILATSCALGPDYEKPEVTLPAGNADDAQTNPLPASWEDLLQDPLLRELLQQVAESNPGLQEAEARLREARAGVRAAGGQNLPTLGAGGTAQSQRQSENNPFLSNIPPPLASNLDPKNNLYRAGLDARWELDLFGGNRRQWQAARARSEAAAAARDGVLHTILAEVALNYAELRGLQKRKQIFERNIKIQSETLNLVQNRVDSGLSSELERSQSRAQLLTTESNLPGIRAGIEARIYALSTLIGKNPQTLSQRLSNYKTLPEIPDSIFQNIPAEVLQRRPDIRRAEQELRAESEEIGQAMADRWPTFSLTGGGGLESTEADSFFDSGSQFWSIGPNIEWALFSGNQIAANIEAQKAQKEASLARYQSQVLQAFREVDTALVQNREERNTARKLQEAVSETRRSVELSKNLYEAGLSDFLTVLDAESRLIVLEDQLARSRTREWTSLMRLYKALGGGWSVDPQ